MCTCSRSCGGQVHDTLCRPEQSNGTHAHTSCCISLQRGLAHLVDDEVVEGVGVRQDDVLLHVQQVRGAHPPQLPEIRRQLHISAAELHHRLQDSCALERCRECVAPWCARHLCARHFSPRPMQASSIMRSVLCTAWLSSCMCSSGARTNNVDALRSAHNRPARLNPWSCTPCRDSEVVWPLHTVAPHSQ